MSQLTHSSTHWADCTFQRFVQEHRGVGSQPMNNLNKGAIKGLLTPVARE